MKLLLTILILMTTTNANQWKYGSPTEIPQEFISDEQALQVCDNLGLEYNYEAMGDTPEEFCIMTESQSE